MKVDLQKKQGYSNKMATDTGFLSFISLPFTPREDATPNYKRNNKSNHENSNPHNYSFSSVSIFFEVHNMPITVHTMETTKPITINIYCGNSLFNIPLLEKKGKRNSTIFPPAAPRLCGSA
jgi:hypothetical protein